MFFVIDGTDGSGKKTQIDLLEKRLRSEGYKVKTCDFPQYDSYSSIFVKKYLNGYFGEAHTVTPKQSSLFYALDRYAASKDMKAFLAEGGVLISNRYTSSNVGHQGGKFSSDEERKQYITWLFELEFDILQIPQPDVTFYLHLPFEIGMEKVKEKTIQRDYIEEKDIHETDRAHMKNAQDAYLFAAEYFDSWETVQCVENNDYRSKEDIHEDIWRQVMERLQAI